MISLILAGKSCKCWFMVLLMEQHRRDGSANSGVNPKVDPFEISNWRHLKSDGFLDEVIYLLYSRNRRNCSFAFLHASTSSKRILFSIWCLIQLYPHVGYARTGEWIVSEMIDWLKVRGDPALIIEIFCNSDPDNWEEPNSGSSTAGSADRVDGRCTQEN